MSAAQPQRTQPIGFVVGVLAGLPQLIPMLIAGFYFAGDRPEITAFVIPGVLGFFAIAVFFQWLAWYRRTFTIGEEDIRVESGILSRAARSVPYERIQDVSLEQKFLPRLFGLVEVKFETGAGGKDDLSLAYLTEAQGEQLRETVRERRDDVEAAATGDEDATEVSAEKGEVLFAMGPGRLFTFGLFEFSLAVFAVLFAAAQQFDFLLPDDFWSVENLDAQLGGTGAQVASLGRDAQVFGALVGLAGLIFVGFATGIVRTALRDWGFTLERTAKGFRRRRGMFTKTDVVMPIHRVQALKFGTRWLRRRFGWHGLKFVSLAQDAGAASHDVAPFAKWGELEPIARAAGFEPPREDLDWHRASGRYRFDSALWTLLFLLPMAAAVRIVLTQISDGPAFSRWIPAALVALALFLALRELFLWRFERHALDARQLYTRAGWLAPKTAVASRVKLHSATISQGPIARLRGYSTLHLGLAGGTLHVDGIPLERARELRTAVLDSISMQDFSELA